MNATCEWIQTSAVPVATSLARMLADTWLDSQEFRVAVFTITIMCCIMVWVTSMVREIMRAVTTVLCKLQACGCAVSAAPCSHRSSSAVPASAVHKMHRTGGGPPPGPPPAN